MEAGALGAALPSALLEQRFVACATFQLLSGGLTGLYALLERRIALGTDVPGTDLGGP